jgi:hypothetical protein
MTRDQRRRRIYSAGTVESFPRSNIRKKKRSAGGGAGGRPASLAETGRRTCASNLHRGVGVQRGALPSCRPPEALVARRPPTSMFLETTGTGATTSPHCMSPRQRQRRGGPWAMAIMLSCGACVRAACTRMDPSDEHYSVRWRHLPGDVTKDT